MAVEDERGARSAEANGAAGGPADADSAADARAGGAVERKPGWSRRRPDAEP